MFNNDPSPIEVIKPGIKFQFPDNEWYERLLAD